MSELTPEQLEHVKLRIAAKLLLKQLDAGDPLDAVTLMRRILDRNTTGDYAVVSAAYRAAFDAMLEACEDVVGLIELYARGDQPSQTRQINDDGSVTVMDGNAAVDEVLKQLRAAIANAEGGEA